MADKRAFYKTKTFYGAVAYAVMLVAIPICESMNITLPWVELAGLVTVWTGYSIADRFRK